MAQPLFDYKAAEKPTKPNDAERDGLNSSKIYDDGAGVEASRPKQSLNDLENADKAGPDNSENPEPVVNDSPSRDELAAGEQAPSHDNSGTLGKGYTGSGALSKGRLSGLRKKRQLLLLAMLPSVAIIGGVIFLALLLPTLKIPQLAVHIEEYRLSRLARTFNRQSAMLTSTKAAIDANPQASEAETKKLNTKTWDKLKSYSPKAVVKNMKATGTLDFEYKPGILGSQRLTAVLIDGKPVSVPNYKFGRFINNYKERIRFSAELNANLDKVLHDNNYLVRTNVSKKLLGAFGINLRWYEKLGRNYRGLSQVEADRLALRETQAKINSIPSEDVRTSALREAAEDAKSANDACLKNNPCTDKLAKTGKLPQTVQDAIDKGVASGGLTKLLSFASTTYAIGMPVCIVYDGSVEASKAYVDSQSQASVKTFFAVASAADQQKKGDVTAEAVGAFNRRVGDIVNSIPEQRAQGISVDTSDEISPQAGRSGEYSVFNALFDPLGLGGAANLIADKLCPALTNTKVGLTVIAGDTLAGLFSGGTSKVAEQGLKEATTAYLKGVTGKVVAKFADPAGRATVKNSAKRFAIGSAKGEGATQGATYLARMIVLSEIGAFTNGTDPNDFANQADMGGTIYANEMNRQATYGRPLSSEETAVLNLKDRQFIARQKENQSQFQRYLAIDNPDSVANHLAVKTSANLRVSKLSELPNLFGTIPQTLANAFRPIVAIMGGHSLAAATSANGDYGIVQWGWSPSEENLIYSDDSDPSFDVLQNAQILNDSGQTEAIAAKYGKCFSSSIGDLIKNGDIKRDENGKIQDSGGCSPSELGPDNNQFGQQMVFRWRLDQSYQNTLDELSGIQNVSE